MVSAHDAINTINEVYGAHQGFRALHAKGQFYAATFTAAPQAAALCRAAHLQGTPVPAYVRFSDGSGHPRARDPQQDVRGMAVSFRLPDGKGTDIVAQTAPRFPVRTPEAFLELTKAAGGAQRKPWLLPAFLSRHPKAVPALIANLLAGAVRPPRSFLDRAYYAIHAFKWIAPDGSERWVRYTWRAEHTDPANGSAKNRNANRLFDDLRERLETAPVRFTLEVQLAGQSDDPNDPTAVWGSDEHITAGTLEITGLDEERQRADAQGQIFVFDPTKLTDGIEASDDPILAFRAAAYSESAKRRATH